MSRTALIYAADGTITGEISCSNDDDMPLQRTARVIVLPPDHEAILDDHREGWLVEIIGGEPRLVKRP